MRLNELVEDGIDIFALEGEIDFHYAPVLRTLLRSKIRSKCPALILDLSDVHWIDSTGLATIIEHLRDAAKYGGILCLAGLKDSIRSIFEVVRLDTLTPIFPSREEAKTAIKQGRVQPPEPNLFGSAA